MHRSSSPTRRAVTLSALLLFLLFASGGSLEPAAAEQGQGAGAGNAPRTSWGDPDLQGVWTANEMHAVPIERSEDLGDSGLLSAEAATERREAATQRTVNAEGIGNYDRAFRIPRSATPSSSRPRRRLSSSIRPTAGSRR